MMARGELEMTLPWLATCRDCGEWCVIWSFNRIPDGLGEWPVPLGGGCPRPERCGQRPYGLDSDHGERLLDLLAELDAEAAR